MLALAILGMTSALNASQVLLTPFLLELGWGIGGGYVEYLQGDPQNMLTTWVLCPPDNCWHPQAEQLTPPQLFTLSIHRSDFPQTFTVRSTDDPDYQAFVDVLTSPNTSRISAGWNFDTSSGHRCLTSATALVNLRLIRDAVVCYVSPESMWIPLC